MNIYVAFFSSDKENLAHPFQCYRLPVNTEEVRETAMGKVCFLVNLHKIELIIEHITQSTHSHGNSETG